MKPVSKATAQRLRYADGYLALGLLTDASDELELIEGEDRLSNEVLILRSDLYMQAKQWDLLEAMARELTQRDPNYEKGWIDRAYSLRGAAEFCLDWLVDDGQGRLVTAPSSSPEIGFITPDGTRGLVTHATTMDLAIIWENFTHTIAAAHELGIEPEFAARLEAARARLYPLKIGKRGNLQEWAEDFIEQDVKHRHVSHLFGVYPGRQITPATPEYFAAARRALELRGDDGTGWSLGWKINFWARFREGDRAHVLVKNLLRPVGLDDGVRYGPGGGVYPNLFDAHPPFQIDGNFAFTAGLCEMLLQSHLDELHLLPALPRAWPTGSITGLRARGGHEVDLAWRDGALLSATVRPRLGASFRVRTGEHQARFDLPAGGSLTLGRTLARTP